MITFKEYNKYQEILDISEDSIAIKNAVVQYDSYSTNKNV